MEARISSELLGPTYHATPYRAPEEQSVTFLLRPELLKSFEYLTLVPAVGEDLQLGRAGGHVPT